MTEYKVEVYKVDQTKDKYKCDICGKNAEMFFKVGDDGILICGSKKCRKQLDDKIFILLKKLHEQTNKTNPRK